MPAAVRALLMGLVLALLACAPPVGTASPPAPRSRVPAGAATVTAVPQIASEISRVGFSPDARLIVAIGFGAVQLWEVETGLLVRTFEKPGGVSAAFLTPDERRLVTVSGATIRVWDVRSGANVLAFGDRAAPITTLALSPDGKRVLSGHDDHTTRLWSVETGALLQTLRGARTHVVPLAFSADGAHVFSGSGELQKRRGAPAECHDCVVREWSAATGALERTLEAQKPVTAIEASPDGRTLLVGASGDWAVWNLDTGTPARVFADPPFAVAAFTDGGASIVTAAESSNELSSDGELRTRSGGPIAVWGALDGVKRAELGEFARGGACKAFAASRDGRWVVAQREKRAGDEQLEVWDVAGRRLVRVLRGVHESALAVAIAADGRRALSAADAIKVWNLETGALVRTFGPTDPANEGNDALYSDLRLTRDGRTAVSRTLGGRLDVWDVERGASRWTLDAEDAQLSPDESTLLVIEQSAAVLDLATGAVRAKLSLGDDARVKYAAFSPDGARVLAQSERGALGVFDAKTGALARTLTDHASEFCAPVFSRDGRYVAGVFQDAQYRDTIALWEVASGQEVHEARAVATPYELALSPDAGRVLAATYGGDDERVTVYDLASGQAVRRLDGYGRIVASVAWPDGRWRALLGADFKTLDVWDLDAGAIVTKLGSQLDVTAGQVGAGDRLLFVPATNGTLRLVRLDTGAWMGIVSVGARWVLFDAHGNFDASRDGGDLVAAVDGLHGYRIDQLANRANRPDLVLAPLGVSPPAALEYFRRRHERRLRKLGLSEDDLAASFAGAPRAAIVDVAVAADRANVVFDLEAASADLLRYNVYANGVPLFGATGKATAGRARRVTEEIALASGKNRIEVGAVDAAGVESLRPFRVVEGPSRHDGDLYLLAFGVSRYGNPKYDLGYPHKDALDLADVARAMQGHGFSAVHVMAYVNDAATVDAVRRAKAFFRDAKVDDTVVLFVGGHGVHARDAAAEYYFATYEVDPHDLAHTAASFELVEDLLQEIAPRKKLFLMDTCESGERDDDDVPDAEAPANARGLRARTTRALVLDGRASRSATVPPSRTFLFDRDRYIENDLTRRSGAVVLSSSRGAELSYELESLKNGVFTKEVVTALVTPAADRDGDGDVSTDELREFVGAEVPKLTAGKQHPTVDRDNLDVRFGLPVVPAAAPILTRGGALAPSP